MIERLPRLLGRLRWPLLAAWLICLAAAGGIARGLPPLLSSGGWYVPGSQSAHVAAETGDKFTGRGETTVALVVHDARYTAAQPEFARRVSGVMRDVADEPALRVTSTFGWSTVPAAQRGLFVARDQRTAIESVGVGLGDSSARRILPQLQQQLTERYRAEQLEVFLVSAATAFGEVSVLSAKGLARAELITLPLILLILLLLYRSVVASIVSLAVGVTTILLSFAVLTIIARHHELSIFVQNAGSMIGLGVSIDYSLFMITRFREELAAGEDVERALANTLRTSGETVIASGMTVIVTVCTLFLVDLNVIRSIAIGGIVAVAFAILVNVLVLPLFLRLLGRRIDLGRVPGRSLRTGGSARWESYARGIMRRPVFFLALAVTGLLALAYPALQMRPLTPDERILPASSSIRQGYDLMQQQYGPGATSSIKVLVQMEKPVSGGGSGTLLEEFERQLAALPHVDRVDSPLSVIRAGEPGTSPGALGKSTLDRLPAEARSAIHRYLSTDNRAILFEVIPDDFAGAPTTRALLEDVRRTAELAQILAGDGVRIDVGGQTAEGTDSNKVIQDSLPVIVAVMLVTIYVLMFLTFRSILLPLKAIAMNALSVGATYGILVLLFQHGIGARLLGIEHTGTLQNFVPVLLLALLISLSTDYEVFLLSRVRERYLATGDNARSLAEGLALTAPLISGAAILMIAVFGAFGLTGLLPIQELGIGMAVAIAIDATLVRLVIVPAAMQLMGHWNWWPPTLRLDRSHPVGPNPDCRMWLEGLARLKEPRP